MQILKVIRAIAVIGSGLYAGIILGDRMGASFARPALTPSDFIVFQQIQHLHFKPVLLPLTLLAVAASLAWTWLVRKRRKDAEFWLAVGGAACMTGAALLTRIVNFPINDALMTWNSASPPTDIWALWAPWEQAHSIRAALSSAAFALEVGALAAASTGRGEQTKSPG